MGPELDSSIHRRFFIVAYPRSIGPHEARARGDGNPGELRACDGAVHLLQSGWFATIAPREGEECAMPPANTDATTFGITCAAENLDSAKEFYTKVYPDF